MKKYTAPRTNVNDWSALWQTSLALFVGLQLHNKDVIVNKDEHLKKLVFLAAKIYYFTTHRLPSFII